MITLAGVPAVLVADAGFAGVLVSTFAGPTTTALSANMTFRKPREIGIAVN